jgi:hypothetical protein
MRCQPGRNIAPEVQRATRISVGSGAVQAPATNAGDEAVHRRKPSVDRRCCEPALFHVMTEQLDARACRREDLEEPHPRRQLRWHTHDVFAGGDELLGEQCATPDMWLMPFLLRATP